jgi:hypothetical protein
MAILAGDRAGGGRGACGGTIEELSQSFPDVIAEARTMFLGAYTSES